MKEEGQGHPRSLTPETRATSFKVKLPWPQVPTAAQQALDMNANPRDRKSTYLGQHVTQQTIAGLSARAARCLFQSLGDPSAQNAQPRRHCMRK